ENTVMNSRTDNLANVVRGSESDTHVFEEGGRLSLVTLLSLFSRSLLALGQVVRVVQSLSGIDGGLGGGLIPLRDHGLNYRVSDIRRVLSSPELVSQAGYPGTRVIDPL